MADMEAQLTARFSAKRGDVALPAALVTLLVDHLVDVEMATEIDEVPPIEETILVAQAAWHQSLRLTVETVLRHTVLTPFSEGVETS